MTYVKYKLVLSRIGYQKSTIYFKILFYYLFYILFYNKLWICPLERRAEISAYATRNNKIFNRTKSALFLSS